MKRQGFLKKLLAGTFALALAAVMTPSVTANAAQKEYTVTLRPGNVGHFGVKVQDGGETVEMSAEYVAALLYGDAATVTKNGAIKVTVAANGDMPSAPNYIIPDDGYFVKPWEPETGTKVTKNQDYVVDYGRLVNGVEYTIEYVDDQSGESVAPFVSAYANIGEEMTVTAPFTLTTSNAGVYVLASADSITLTLQEDASANVFTFRYTYSYDPGTVTQEYVTYTEGEIVETTETNSTYIDNGTAVDNVDGLGQDDGGNGENNGDDQDTINIDDDPSALADGDEVDDGEETPPVTIFDDSTPLGNFLNDVVENPVKIWAIAAGIAALALVIVWAVVRKKRKQAAEAAQE